MTHIVCNNRMLRISELASKKYYEILVSKKLQRSHMESVWCREFDILKHADVWNKVYTRKVKSVPIKKVSEFNYKIYYTTCCTQDIL